MLEDTLSISFFSGIRYCVHFPERLLFQTPAGKRKTFWNSWHHPPTNFTWQHSKTDICGSTAQPIEFDLSYKEKSNQISSLLDRISWYLSLCFNVNWAKTLLVEKYVWSNPRRNIIYKSWLTNKKSRMTTS